MTNCVALPAIGIISYLVGGINPAYLISKIKGFDIRDKGSGNAGATNALMLLGKKIGLLIALLDIFKAFILVRVSGLVFPQINLAKEIAGSSCIIGHIFPAHLRFKGGKGLACLGGVILAFSPMCFLIMLLVEVLLALITRYICVVPITASVAFSLIYFLSGGTLTGFAIYLAISSVMFCKHIENMKRIRAGKELRVNYLWDKDGELKRIGESTDKDVNQKG